MFYILTVNEDCAPWVQSFPDDDEAKFRHELASILEKSRKLATETRNQSCNHVFVFQGKRLMYGRNPITITPLKFDDGVLFPREAICASTGPDFIDDGRVTVDVDEPSTQA